MKTTLFTITALFLFSCQKEAKTCGCVITTTTHTVELGPGLTTSSQTSIIYTPMSYTTTTKKDTYVEYKEGELGCQNENNGDVVKVCRIK